MNLHIRRAGALDAAAMAELLNGIIRAGGTTALTTERDAEDLRGWMASAPGRSAWHLAEDDGGRLLGFQWIEPSDTLPETCCDIATFVRRGETGIGIGIGSALFSASRAAARALGYTHINATIRADNSGGRAYYQSRGFEEVGRERGVTLGDGTRTDRVITRLRLD